MDEAMRIYYSFLYMCAMFLFVPLTLEAIGRAFKKNFEFSKTFLFLWAFSFLIVVPTFPYFFGYRTTQIGSQFAASEYTEMYYVILSDRPCNNLFREAHAVPAEIEKIKEYDGPGYNSYYRVNYIYPYAEKRICISDLGDVSPNKERRVEDFDGNEYYVTLTEIKFPADFFDVWTPFKSSSSSDRE